MSAWAPGAWAPGAWRGTAWAAIEVATAAPPAIGGGKRRKKRREEDRPILIELPDEVEAVEAVTELPPEKLIAQVIGRVDGVGLLVPDMPQPMQRPESSWRILKRIVREEGDDDDDEAIILLLH